MKKHVPSLILTAVFNFTHQYFLIAGVFLLFPGITAILEESTLLFSFLLSYLFIPSERYFIRDRILRTGIIITLTGLAFTLIPEVISSGSSAADGGNSVRGVIYILISSASWALFTFMIKTRVPPVESYFATSFLFTIVVPLFVITMLFEGGGRIILPEAPMTAWAVLAVSSLVGIGLAYSFYYTSIKMVGIMFSSTIGLLIPVIASIISFFLFDERLSLIQIAGSIVLLSGCLIIVRREAGLSQESRNSAIEG